MTLSVLDCLIKIESSDRENQVMIMRQMKPRPVSKESNSTNLLSWEEPKQDGRMWSKCGHYFVAINSYWVPNPDYGDSFKIGGFGGKAGQAVCETHARRHLAKQTMNLACLVLGIQKIADVCRRHRSQVSRWKNGHTLVPVELCSDIEDAIVEHNGTYADRTGRSVVAENLRPDVEFTRKNGVIATFDWKKEI